MPAAFHRVQVDPFLAGMRACPGWTQYNCGDTLLGEERRIHPPTAADERHFASLSRFRGALELLHHGMPRLNGERPAREGCLDLRFELRITADAISSRMPLRFRLDAVL